MNRTGLTALWFSALAALISVLTACQTAPLLPREMVPQLANQAYIHTNKTIMVSPVTGGGIAGSSLQSVVISNNDLRETIINTLGQANMFRTVSSDTKSDYVMTAEILGQRMNVGYANVMTLLVRYTLVDSTNATAVWEENILAQDYATTAEVFMGGQRERLVAQRSMQKNMSSLLQHLNSYFRNPDNGIGRTIPAQPSLPAPPVPAVSTIPPTVKPQATTGGYPRKLTGKEISEHFQRHKIFTFDQAPKVDFTITIKADGSLERYCRLCTMAYDSGAMQIKVAQDRVCIDWDMVSYPRSGCFELIQMDKHRYHLVDQDNGEVYGYTLP